MDGDDPAIPKADEILPMDVEAPKIEEQEQQGEQVARLKRFLITDGHVVEKRYDWFKLPARAVTIILDTWYQQLGSDASSFNYGWPAQLQSPNQHTAVSARRMWSYMWLGNKMEELAKESITWDQAVNEHPFWTGYYNLINRGILITLQDPFLPPRLPNPSSTGSDSDSKSTQPNPNSTSSSHGGSGAITPQIFTQRTFHSRPHGKTPTHGATRSNISIYYKDHYCRPCFFFDRIHGYKHRGIVAQSTVTTTSLGYLLACNTCSWDSCGNCLSPSSMWRGKEVVSSYLRQNYDTETFGNAYKVCYPCRAEAAKMGLLKTGLNAEVAMRYVRGWEGRMSEWLLSGTGTIKQMVEWVMMDIWLRRSAYLDPQRLKAFQTGVEWRSASRKAWEEVVRRYGEDSSDGTHERAWGLSITEMVKDHRFGDKDIRKIHNAAQETLITERIDRGWWVSHAEDHLFPPPTTPYQPLESPTSDPTHLVYQTFDPDPDNSETIWAPLSHEIFSSPPPPPHTLGQLNRTYMELFAGKVAEPLMALKEMLLSFSYGRTEVALAKAEALSVEELAEWLKDPRNRINGWWKKVELPAMEGVDVVWPEKKVVPKRKRENREDGVVGPLGSDEEGESEGTVPEQETMEVDSGIANGNENEIDSPGATSPYFDKTTTPNAKRRKPSTEGSSSIDEVTMKDLTSEESGAGATPNGLSVEFESAGSSHIANLPSPIPQTPPLALDDCEMTTSSSDDSTSPVFTITTTVQKPAPPPNPLQRLGRALPPSFIAECLAQIPWPTPKARLSPSEYRVFQENQMSYSGDGEERLAYPRAPVTSSTAQVIKTEWRGMWKAERKCNCGICQRIDAADRAEKEKIAQMAAMRASQTSLALTSLGLKPTVDDPMMRQYVALSGKKELDQTWSESSGETLDELEVDRDHPDFYDYDAEESDEEDDFDCEAEDDEIFEATMVAMPPNGRR